MVATRAMTVRPSRMNAVIKYLLLMLALFASIGVPAQEQNNPLFNRILDKIEQMQNEVNELRNQNELTQFEVQTLQKNLDAQLSELKTKFDTSHTTSTVSPASVITTPTETQLKQLMDDFKKLNQKMTRTNNRLDELARIVETLQSRKTQTPETPAIEPEQPQTIEQPKETAPQPKTKVSPIEPAKLPDEDEYAAYSKAMSALDRADYTRLRDNLTRFLQDYPDGDYADDANYWVAESYYAEGDLEQAKPYFMQLIENYSDSEKREPALLKVAYIRLSNKQWEAARKIFESLKNDAEDEQIRKLAIEQLEQLERKGH